MIARRSAREILICVWQLAKWWHQPVDVVWQLPVAEYNLLARHAAQSIRREQAAQRQRRR